MKNSLSLTLLFLISTSLFASEWKLGVGIYYADISGFNAFEASENTNKQQTKNLTVPFIFAAKPIGDKVNLNFRFSYYDEIVTNGSSSDGNIFNDPNLISPSVLTPYRFFESIKESSVSINYVFINNDKWKIEAGPSLSFARVNSDMFGIDFTDNSGSNIVTGQLGRKFATFTDNSFSLGAEAKASFKLTNKFSFNLTYRYTSPSEKNIHLLGASIAYRL